MVPIHAGASSSSAWSRYGLLLDKWSDEGQV
jgi:hypothetical protein